MSDDTFLTLHEGAGQDSPQGRLQLLLLLRTDMMARWQRGERFPVEDYFRKYPLLRSDAEALLELVYLEALLREGQGDSPLVEEYVRRFPHHSDSLRRHFELHTMLREAGQVTERVDASPQGAERPGTTPDLNAPTLCAGKTSPGPCTSRRSASSRSRWRPCR